MVCCRRSSSIKTELNSIVGGEFMDIANSNRWWLGGSNGIVRCGNRRRPQKPLEPGRREHDEIVILDVSAIAQLVGNVARSDESVASPENKGLAADDDFQFSGEDIVRLVLTRMGMTRHCHARRETDVQETVCSSRYRRPTNIRNQCPRRSNSVWISADA